MWTNQYNPIPSGHKFHRFQQVRCKIPVQMSPFVSVLNKVCPEFYHIQQEKDNTFVRVISCSLRPSKAPIPLQGHRVHKTKFHKGYQTTSATLPAWSFSLTLIFDHRENRSPRGRFRFFRYHEASVAFDTPCNTDVLMKENILPKKGVDRCSRI
jgi:hypothetical protein